MGVNCLPNGPDGAVGSAPLAGRAVDFVTSDLVAGPVAWDQAQVSVCYAGYPKPWHGENESAFNYRRNRDAAHVDGLHGEGQPRRRFLREFHQFILGIPLNDAPAQAAPFVIWEGSHRIMQAALARALAPHPPESWSEVDLTEPYQAARRQVFDSCPRVEVHAKPGEAYVAHRHALHGVAGWEDDLDGPEDGRMIAYFRPESGATAQDWARAGVA